MLAFLSLHLPVQQCWKHFMLTETKASNINACILSQFSNRNCYRNDYLFFLCRFKWNGHCCCSIGININWNFSFCRIHRLVSKLTNGLVRGPCGCVREYLILKCHKELLPDELKLRDEGALKTFTLILVGFMMMAGLQALDAFSDG